MCVLAHENKCFSAISSRTSILLSGLGKTHYINAWKKNSLREFYNNVIMWFCYCFLCFLISALRCTRININGKTQNSMKGALIFIHIKRHDFRLQLCFMVVLCYIFTIFHIIAVYWANVDKVLDHRYAILSPIKMADYWIMPHHTYIIHHIRSRSIVRSDRNFIFRNYLESNTRIITSSIFLLLQLFV